MENELWAQNILFILSGISIYPIHYNRGEMHRLYRNVTGDCGIIHNKWDFNISWFNKCRLDYRNKYTHTTYMAK